MKIKIRLDTMGQVREFVNLANTITEQVKVTDGRGLSVNGKSLMGMLYSLEFAELWCECEKDVYTTFSAFECE